MSARIVGLGRIGRPVPADPYRAQNDAIALATKGLGDGLHKIRAIPKERLLVVKGEFDKIEAVLDAYRIEHTLIESVRGRQIRPEQILFVNCGRAPLGYEPERIADFVKQGGWLMTSDWALEPYVTGSFPDLVRVFHPRRQRDVVVAIEERAPGHRLLEGALDPKRKLLWWLEDESIFFRLTGGAEVLVSSAEMKERFGTEVVAFTKSIGKGRIAHVLGHFFQEQGTLEGVAGMQRMILNFILARLES